MSWEVFLLSLLVVVALARMGARYASITRSEREFTTLLLLSFRGADGITGREIVEASGGAVSRGSVYVILGDMEDRGLVRSTPEPVDPRIGIPVRRYFLTDKGWKEGRA
jgi:DNA-binding PadR family transcriptional regulator